MTTALEVIIGALRAIQVHEAGEDPDADVAQDALGSMNRMMHGWRNKNVNIEHVDLILTDDVKLDDRHHEGLIYLLAIRLAPEYEKSVSTEVAMLAETGWRGIQSHFTIPNDLKIEGLPPSRLGGIA